MKNEDATLARLVALWDKQKAEERRATAARIQTEKDVAARVEAIGIQLPVEGATTINVDGGFKITITNKLNRKITDEAKLVELESDIPENMRPWTRVETIRLEPVGLRWLYDNEPGLAALCGEFIEEKPAKANFKIARTE